MTDTLTWREREGLAPWHEAMPRSPDGWAFFLDIDGTLVDIAPTPEGVVVPPSLPPTIAGLWKRTGGALALLTGRSVPMVDQILAPYYLPVGAIHGTLIRHVTDTPFDETPHPGLPEIRWALRRFLDAHPAALLEDKGSAVAIHFRQDPGLAAKAELAVRDAVAPFAGELAVQPGKMVFEIKPVGSDKGTALETFMASPPFAGRRPIAIGDDVTDESMFRAAVAAGGVALRVGAPRGETAAITAFADAADVRDWLSRL
jgi:trehalose 6-phosphate phosphatase